MSGHSKWATIKRAKGATDAKRGALFTPMLIIYAIGMARMAGLKWAQSRAVHIAFCALATVLIAFCVF